MDFAPPNGSNPVKTDQTSGLEPTSLSTTTGFPATRRPAPGTAPTPPAAPGGIWLLRTWVVIRVAFFIELGMVLVVLPWTRGWTENHLLLAYPQIRFFLQNNFVRGLISGLGFLDIGFGIWEAVRYKEPPRNRPEKLERP
jgi:hypothetical protein